MESRAVVVVGGEPSVSAWVRDGLAAAPRAYVLQPTELPPTETGTPPQAVRRLLHPSFTTAMRQSSHDGMFVALRRALRQTMQARLGYQPVASVPEGLAFAEWLADECGCRVVCLGTHPLSVAARHKRESPDPDPEHWIEQAFTEWLAACEWLAGYQERRRDFAIAWDDELVGEPFVGFHRLYRQLGLDWSERSQASIGAMLVDAVGRREASAVRPEAWRDTLTEDEVHRVREAAERHVDRAPRRSRCVG